LRTIVDVLLRGTLRWQGCRSHWIDTSVGRMHVLEVPGSGRLPPLVLLHGLASAGVHYFPLLTRLRQCSRRLLVPDLPAHGWSDAPAERLHARILQQGVIEALDALVDEPVVVFGNSIGGGVAIHYGLARPQAVLGLVLCSPAGTAMHPGELRRLRRLFRVRDQTAALSFVDRLLARRHPLRQLLAWELRRTLGREVLRELLASIQPGDLLEPEQLQALKAPVLLIWGGAERILPRSQLLFLRKHLPGLVRVEEPGHFGHSPYLEDPAALAQSIQGFLEEMAPAGAVLAGAGVGSGRPWNARGERRDSHRAIAWQHQALSHPYAREGAGGHGQPDRQHPGAHVDADHDAEAIE
jgi:pimeloyl-ACP methyl ester carboxylesterase